MNTSSSDNDDNESIIFSPVDESFISNEQDDYHHHHYDIPVATTSTNDDTVNHDTVTMDGANNTRQQVPQPLLTTGISTHPPNSNSNNNNNNSSSSSSNLSLLERIQQAKKQQTHPTRKVKEGEESDSLLLLQDDFMNDDSNGEYGFVQRHGENDNDLTQTQQENVHMTRIPDYSASDTIRNDHMSSYEYNNGTDGGDYGGGRRIGGGHQGVLSALAKVGNTVGSMTKSAYHGTRYLYHTVVAKNNNYNISSNRGQTQGEFPLQERMCEMDYQRESLLLDPHEVEDGTVLPMEQASPLVGLRSGMMGSSSYNSHVSVGMGGSSSSCSHRGHACIGCLSQFCVDVKDIFMGLSRNKKLAVIAFVLFLVWLFISEERQHHHHGQALL